MGKKITIFVGTLEKGGAERVISILSKKMIENEMDVEILLFYNSKIYYPIDERIKVTSVEKETGSTNLMKNLFWMRRYIKNNTGCLISFLASLNIFALTASLGLNIPVIVADRNDPRKVPESYLKRKLRDVLYHLAYRVVVQTSHNKEYFNNIIKRKTIIIHNPVDLGNDIGIAIQTPKKKKIVTVGRLMQQKNQKLLIDSFSSVSQKYPEYCLCIYGEGPVRKELEDYIQGKHLEEKVFLMGQVDNIFEEISDAELFVLSSDYEGMPNALIEAMCIGLPVISTDVSGAKDLIENNVSGIVVDVNSKKQLTEAMEKMLANEAFRVNCSRKAINVAKRLSPDVIFKEWLDVIGEVYDKIEKIG